MQEKNTHAQSVVARVPLVGASASLVGASASLVGASASSVVFNAFAVGDNASLVGGKFSPIYRDRPFLFTIDDSLFTNAAGINPGGASRPR